MTHSEMILAYIEQHGSITPMEALEQLGCMRLGARIYDLKRQGYDIKAEMENGVNRRGEKCRWARYRMGARA